MLYLSHSSNLKSRPGVFHLLWCSDACNMALNWEFSFANRAAGLSNSKIWKWKIEHQSLPAYKSAPAYPFCIQRTYKIKAQFGYKYSKLADFPWEGNISNQNFKYQPNKIIYASHIHFYGILLRKESISGEKTAQYWHFKTKLSPKTDGRSDENWWKLVEEVFLETNSNIRRIAAISLNLENVFTGINDNILQWQSVLWKDVYFL